MISCSKGTRFGPYCHTKQSRWNTDNGGHVNGQNYKISEAVFVSTENSLILLYKANLLIHLKKHKLVLFSMALWHKLTDLERMGFGIVRWKRRLQSGSLLKRPAPIGKKRQKKWLSNIFLFFYQISSYRVSRSLCDRKSEINFT